MATSSMPAAKKDLLGQIKKEAEDLDEMVRNLLAITRIDAGALELRRDWIDLREVVERVVSAARRHGARQHIEIESARRPSAGAGRRHFGRAGASAMWLPMRSSTRRRRHACRAGR